MIQVRLPSVKAVQLSALRHTISPPSVRCSALPLGTKRWFSTQSPTLAGPTRSRSVPKPRTNWQGRDGWGSVWALADAAPGTIIARAARGPAT